MNRLAVGVVQGLCAALLVQAGVMALRGDSAPRPAALLDERAGVIREIAVHYVPEAEFPDATLAEFFRQLPPGVRVYVACERRDHFDAFVRLTGREAVPVILDRPITPWARDRFAACAEGLLVVPPEPHPGGVERRNDWLVPFAFARAAEGATRAAPFSFDGGDFCAAGDRILCTSAWSRRNPGRPPEDLAREAEEIFGQPVVYLPDAPDHHIGMVLAPVGRDTVLVGDARWGASLRPAGVDADVSDETARRFDAIAEALIQAGFQVERVPVVPTRREYAWISYTNAIFEDDVVYLPVYGLSKLDNTAAATYRRLGFEVRPVDVSRVWEHGGTLHCLVHVLRRG